MALSEFPRREAATSRFVRLHSADVESQMRLDEYYYDQTARVGEPIASPNNVVFDSATITETAPSPKGPKVSERRAVIIHTLITSPEAPATPYWTDFMRRHTNRIVNFARTASNKGQEIDPQFR